MLLHRKNVLVMSVLAATALLLLSACGDGGGATEDTGTPTATATATVRRTPTPVRTASPPPTATATVTPSPTPSPTQSAPTSAPTPASTPAPTPAPTPTPEPALRVDLSAKDIRFSTGTISVPRGVRLSLRFTNNDIAPHNFTLWQSSSTQNKIFQGETFSGPGQTRVHEFTAPQSAGTYYFNCTIHPNTMSGDFVVQ